MMLEAFQTFLVGQGKADNTVKSYCQAVGAYLKWYEETFGQQAGGLYRANVLDYVSYLRTVKELSNKSVNAKLAALSSLNEFLISSGAQTDTVVGKSDYLKVQVPYANPCTVSKDDVEAFRQRILVRRGARDYAIVTILAYAGLRVSECLALRPEDVELSAREITVHHGKGDKLRVVFIGDKVINAVREYKKVRPDGSPYLFVSRKGGKLSRGQVNRIFNDYSDTITPHTLRHFFCTQALEIAGYGVHELANQAGHSNIHTTLIYTNPTREKMKDKANKL